jgi:hypothetical protein
MIRKKEDNNSDTIYNLRSSFNINTRIQQYEQKPTIASKIKYSNELKDKTGFMPIKCAFTDLALNPYSVYIPDLLHGPKKGVFANLLTALEKYLIHNGWLDMVEERMRTIPKFQSVEKFGKSFFRMTTLTASNYNDMVSKDYEHRQNSYHPDLKSMLISSRLDK